MLFLFSMVVDGKISGAVGAHTTGLIEDVKDVSDPDLVICSICGDLFTSLAFKQHQHQTKPYQCHYCPKQFNKQYNLTQHVRIHTGNKLPCALCDKTFNDKSSLIKHKNAVHLKMKAHKCSICSKHFSRKGHLTEHMAVHSKIKKYKCSICDKDFPFLSSLSAHRRRHEGRRFDCSYCGKVFKDLRSLKNHMLQVHKPHDIDSSKQLLNTIDAFSWTRYLPV